MLSVRSVVFLSRDLEAEQSSIYFIMRDYFHVKDYLRVNFRFNEELTQLT